MSSQYTGTVERVYNKNGRWALLMDDEQWYGLGYNKPDFEAGVQARFRWEQSDNGKYRNIIGKVQHKGEGRPAPQRQYNGRAKAPNGKDNYWTERAEKDVETQKRISYQAATNTALAFVTAALDREFIKMTGKNKMEAFQALVEEEAMRFFRIYQEAPTFTTPVEEIGEEPPADDESFEDDDEWN